jgi:hypothetical protein
MTSNWPLEALRLHDGGGNRPFPSNGTVRFLAGRKVKGGRSRDWGDEGLPGIITTRRGACVDKAGARMVKEERANESRVEGGSEVGRTEPSRYSDCRT